VRVDNDVILRHLATGVLTASASGNVAYLNPAAEQVLGLHSLEVRSRPLAVALPERLRPLRALILDTLARREPVRAGSRCAPRAAGRCRSGSPPTCSCKGVLHGVVAVFRT
jgi:PAS domain S-box-containing protein